MCEVINHSQGRRSEEDFCIVPAAFRKAGPVSEPSLGAIYSFQRRAGAQMLLPRHHSHRMPFPYPEHPFLEILNSYHGRSTSSHKRCLCITTGEESWVKIRWMHLTKEEKRKWVPGLVFHEPLSKRDFSIGISHVFCFFVLYFDSSLVTSSVLSPCGKLVRSEAVTQQRGTSTYCPVGG